MDEQKIEDLLEFYVLGTLSEQEKSQVEAYIAQNPEARVRLEAMMPVSKWLPFGIVPIEPSPKVKETLMARVQSSARARQATLESPAPTTVRTATAEKPSWSFFDWLRTSLAVPTFAAVSLVLLLVAVGWVMNLNGRLQAQSTRIASIEESNEYLSETVATLESVNTSLAIQIQQLQSQRDALTIQVADLTGENDDLAAQLAAQEEVLALFSSPQVQTVAVTGTEEQPGASAQIIYDAESQVAILAVTGLEALAPDQAYQVLLIRSDGHDTAETFKVDTEGYSVLLVHSLAPFETFDAVGVSIEPASGSPQRTGEIVLLGNLVN